jgi:hypothetical protein
MVFERGREEWVFLMEEDCENLWWCRRSRGWGFGECMTNKVGDGLDTFFWTDLWLDGIPLSERFERLFDLAENKSSTIAEMSSFVDRLSKSIRPFSLVYLFIRGLQFTSWWGLLIIIFSTT